MNANELADDLNGGDVSYITMDKAATMLRQQQAEIEALKAKTLTDEEVEEVYRTVEQDFYLTESKKPDGGWRNFPVELGRAILRKAQEK